MTSPKLAIVTTAVFTAMAVALTGIADARTVKKHRRHVIPPPQQHIACTAIGCVRVPPGCGQTEGRTWSGMPTGHDVIVCPPGVAPFR
jgi:hypothetical protein